LWEGYGNKEKTKAFRCGVAGKQKKAEYDKQYRMKRKLLLQQQASTSSETDLVQKQMKAEYAKRYRLKRKLLLQQQASTFNV
jgi:hypothetical protein